jgi:photosystem II stability/assembly factor-like uncharacterized protein
MHLKKPVLVLLIFCAVVFADWQQIGPYGGYVRSVVVSGSNENIVYATSYASPTNIAKSTNGGSSWTTVGSISNQAYCLDIDPTNDTKLYAGSGHAMYRSTNGGVTWVSTSMTNKYIYGIAVNPGVVSTIYASGMSYSGSKWTTAFFKSTDSGVSWTTVVIDTNQGQANCVAVDRTRPNTVYVGGYWYNPDISTNCPLVYKTTDAGATWSNITGAIPSAAYYVYSMAVHPTNSNLVYSGTYMSGIYRSTDAGATWAQTSTHYYNYAMAVSPIAPDVVYSAGYSDVYKTTDAGLTWAATGAGFAGNTPYGLAMSTTSASVVYAGDNNGVFKTTSAGSSWFNTNNNINLGSICSFAVAPSSPAVMYTSFEAIGVFKTTNSGTNWALLPTPVGCGNICEFAVNNTDPNTVYALEGSG